MRPTPQRPRMTADPPLLYDVLDARERLHLTYVKNASMRGVEEITRALAEAGYDVPVVTRSRASDRFVDIGEKLVDTLDGRPLGGLQLAAVMMDATDVGDEQVAWALGKTLDGRKVLLGIARHLGESEKAYGGLLDDLKRAGLDLRDALVVVDGHRGSMAALEAFDPTPAGVRSDDDEVAGRKRTIVQRCTLHVSRNVVVDHMKVTDYVRIGRQLVAELKAGAPADADDPDDPEGPRATPKRLGRGRLAQLGKVRALRPRTQEDRRRKAAAERKCLAEIGEQFVRGELRRAWNQPTVAAAEKGLERVARWLDGWKLEAAARSLRASAEGTLTLQRIGVEDGVVRRHLRTTNAVESAHTGVSDWEERVKRWRATGEEAARAIRRRFAAVALALAEKQSWKRMEDPERLMEVPLRVLAARYAPEVELGIAWEPGGPAVLERLALAAGTERDAFAALGDLIDRVDGCDLTLRIGDGVLEQVLSPEQAAQWRERHGFVVAQEGERTFVRAPRFAGVGVERGGPDGPAREAAPAAEPAAPATQALDADRAAGPAAPAPRDRDAADDLGPGASAPPDRHAARGSAAHPRPPDAALAQLRAAVDGDPRMLAGVAEAALAVAPHVLQLEPEERDRAAARLGEAAGALAAVAADVRARWEDRGWREAVVLQLAAQHVRSRAGDGAARSGLTVGQRLVLGDQRADWLLARAHARAHAVRDAGPEWFAAVDRDAGGALQQLDGAIGTVEAAALALAATRARELEERLTRARERARAREEAGPAQIPEPDERAAPPDERYRRALGGRRAGLLAALESRMRDLNDAELLELAADVGAPWRALNRAEARETLLLEELERPRRVREYGEALSGLADLEAKADQRRWSTVRRAAREALPEAQASVRRSWEAVRGVEERLTALRAQEGSLDAVMTRADAPLQYAVDVELARRGREQAQERAAEREAYAGLGVAPREGVAAAQPLPPVREAIGAEIG